MKLSARSPNGFACLVVLSGCTLFSPINMGTQKNELSSIPHDLPGESTHSATLLVLIPEAMPTYATTRMAYSTEAYSIAYFAKHEWAETPAQMIQPLIAQTLQNTHYFSAVLSPPYFGHFTFGLRSEILEIQQDFTSEPPIFKLAVRFSLTRTSTNQVVASKDLSVTQPMLQKSPYAGVLAANQALPKLLRELARFVIDNAG